MEKKNKVFYFILGHSCLILFIITFLVIIVDANFGETCTNICYSIIAAGLFYFFDVYIPYMYKKKAYRKLVKHQLFLLVESLRLCREIAVKFNMNEINRNEYIEIFSRCNLNERRKTGRLTILEYINLKKEKIRAIITSLLSQSQFLEFIEYETLIKILDSPFLREEIIAIDDNLPDSLLTNDYNNQRKIGESIYDNYQMSIKIINYENN